MVMNTLTRRDDERKGTWKERLKKNFIYKVIVGMKVELHRQLKDRVYPRVS